MEQNLLLTSQNELDKCEGNKIAQLTQDEMSRIAELERGYRFFRPEEWWPDSPVPVFY